MRPGSPYAKGRQAARGKKPKPRQPPFEVPLEPNALDPHTAWLRGYDDQTKQAAERRAAKKKTPAEGRTAAEAEQTPLFS